jgi:hypothetical protein
MLLIVVESLKLEAVEYSTLYDAAFVTAFQATVTWVALFVVAVTPVGARTAVRVFTLADAGLTVEFATAYTLK